MAIASVGARGPTTPDRSCVIGRRVPIDARAAAEDTRVAVWRYIRPFERARILREREIGARARGGEWDRIEPLNRRQSEKKSQPGQGK